MKECFSGQHKTRVIDSNFNAHDEFERRRAEAFCKDFVGESDRPRYLFGRNIYAEPVVRSVSVDGFIDDFAQEDEYLGIPIFRIDDVPGDALVLILASGKPFTARARVERYGLECLDYFAFYKYSGLSLEPVLFLGDFDGDFREHQDKYNAVYRRLKDDVSKAQFEKLVKFKLSYNLAYLEGFTCREDEQYFEDFLGLKETGEVFVDVGSFDGYTTQEFIRRCPEYTAIHVFEPDPENMPVVRERLAPYRDVSYFAKGLSDQRQVCRFSVEGSISRMSDDGAVSIQVDQLDSILDGPVTFIKMDIEGAECAALRGAQRIIREHHPKLALCVYHNTGDFWRIPELVLSIRNDYDVYLRHYSESIYETVMFFVPSSGPAARQA